MKCEKCKFFNQLWDEDVEGESGGTCQRYPPTPLKTNEDGYGLWPQVISTEWCGEFVAAPIDDKAKN